MWALDHEADIDADFLAIYGIDLEQADVSGPRYFALAYRLTAYQGVMQARMDEASEQQQPSSSTPTRTQDTAPPTRQGAGETAEVSLTQFRAKFPGLVSVAQGG